MQVISHSPNQTIYIGKALARHLRARDIVCLFGPLGSGKTVLIKGIAAGLGIDRNSVVSPTFVLLRQHNSKVAFFHFDLYRLLDPREILGLGYEEYLYGDGITVIEWADRLDGYLPVAYLKVELLVKTQEARVLKFAALGKHYQDLLEKFHEDLRA